MEKKYKLTDSKIAFFKFELNFIIGNFSKFTLKVANETIYDKKY